MKGVVHKIVAATKDRDAGEYECSVNVTLKEYSGKPLDSNVATITLSVYGKLYILHSTHFTTTMFPSPRYTLDNTMISHKHRCTFDL